LLGLLRKRTGLRPSSWWSLGELIYFGEDRWVSFLRFDSVRFFSGGGGGVEFLTARSFDDTRREPFCAGLLLGYLVFVSFRFVGNADISERGDCCLTAVGRGGGNLSPGFVFEFGFTPFWLLSRNCAR
jgi:hypothetical protein